MSPLYLETSAVLTWLLAQARAPEVRAVVDEAELVVTSSLTCLEAERAIIRAEADGQLRAADAQRTRGLLQRAQAGWMMMAVSEEVLSMASRRFPLEPVRALDAIHLATALTFVRAIPDLKLLSLDRRIQENATALGLG